LTGSERLSIGSAEVRRRAEGNMLGAVTMPLIAVPA